MADIQNKEAVTRADHGPGGKKTETIRVSSLHKCNHCSGDLLLLDQSCVYRTVTLSAFKKMNPVDIYISRPQDKNWGAKSLFGRRPQKAQ